MAKTRIREALEVGLAPTALWTVPPNPPILHWMTLPSARSPSLPTLVFPLSPCPNWLFWRYSGRRPGLAPERGPRAQAGCKVALGARPISGGTRRIVCHTQARKRRTNRNFWVQISSGGVGVFHPDGWGPKSSVCPRKTKLFGGMSRYFCWHIPGVPEKFEKKCLCSILGPMSI